MINKALTCKHLYSSGQANRITAKKEAAIPSVLHSANIFQSSLCDLLLNNLLSTDFDLGK